MGLAVSFRPHPLNPGRSSSMKAMRIILILLLSLALPLPVFAKGSHGARSSSRTATALTPPRSPTTPEAMTASTRAATARHRRADTTRTRKLAITIETGSTKHQTSRVKSCSPERQGVRNERIRVRMYSPNSTGNCC